MGVGLVMVRYALLAALLFFAPAFAQDPPLPVEVTAVLTWDIPTENVDGSPLVDLAGFNIYWGQVSRSYSDTVDIADPASDEYTWIFEVDVPTTIYFAMTAYDDDGNESAFSNEVFKEFTADDAVPPGAPTLRLISVSCRRLGNGELRCKVIDVQ